MTLPNFLVIGAQRAGTTLLYRLLDAHPEVFVPYRRKEVHYFDRYIDRGVQWYQEFFPERGFEQQYKAIGEVTADYIFDQQVPRRIHELLPACRLLVSLRHPVERAYSWYLYSVRSFNEKRAFAEFVSADPEPVKRGLYSEQLARYFELFPREAILTLIYEELVADPAGQLERLAAFLGLDRGWDDPHALMRERVNTSGAPRFRAAFAGARRLGELLTQRDLDWPVRWAKRAGIGKMFGTAGPGPSLPPAARAWLETHYREEIRRLEDLLDRDLEIWRTGVPSPTSCARLQPAENVGG